MKHIILLLLIFLTSYTQPARAYAPAESTTLATLSLEEAIEIAHKNKPSLQALEQRIYVNKVEERKAWAGYYPTANFLGDLAQQSGQQVLQTTAIVQGQQLVYDFSGPQAQAKRAQKNTEAQRYFTQQSYNDVRLDVARTFLECWRIQQQNEAIRALNTSSQAVFDQASHQNKVNLLDKNVFLKNAEDYANDIATVHVYHDNLEIFQRRLEFLMGQVINLNILPSEKTKSSLVPTTKLVWNDDHEIKLEPVNVYHALAIENHPEIKEQQKNIEFQQEDEKIALNQHLPRFFLHGQTGATRKDITGFRNFHSFGLRMDWDIFNLPIIDYQAKQARARKLEATLLKQEIENRVRSDVETAYYTLALEASRLRAEKFHYARARNEFTLRKQEMDTGLISTVELSTAKTTWENAQIALINQKVITEVRRQELLHKCGYSEKIVV
ncbi:TolC family protein [Candidatus Babeliales bacterium]|nr:TolC family protein [Candidatus Babeliales bacterium]MBY0353812.1 TolC family protein [Candidatus Babeliales bacterium]